MSKQATWDVDRATPLRRAGLSAPHARRLKRKTAGAPGEKQFRVEELGGA
jgi:hypothetical protein